MVEGADLVFTAQYCKGPLASGESLELPSHNVLLQSASKMGSQQCKTSPSEARVLLLDIAVYSVCCDSCIIPPHNSLQEVCQELIRHEYSLGSFQLR